MTAWNLYLGPVLGRWRGQAEESGRTQVENAWLRLRGPAVDQAHGSVSAALTVTVPPSKGEGSNVGMRPSVSRETSGRLWLAAWKWGRCWLHERRCPVRCIQWLTPGIVNHTEPNPSDCLRSEETRHRQVLGLPRFHVKHGKWLSRRRGNCAVRP